jgi:glycosyltransferase involved in cell wall biosynthesis
VALLSEVFEKDMGYLPKLLSKYLARLGADVHVVATDLPPYHQMDAKERKEIYGGFAADGGVVPNSVEAFQGFTLHILRHRKVFGYVQMVGLNAKLRAIRPDIVQTTIAVGWLPLQAAYAMPLLGYKLFTGNHHHASVFPLAKKKTSPWSYELLRCRIMRTLPGWLVSQATEKCYAITSDCADVAARFFGVPRKKIDVCPLGVDAELFRPVSNENDRADRLRLRQRLGFSDSDIVCIYSGRFTEDKNPLLLGKAVERLIHMGHPFRGLFVGNGVQAQAIQACAGCVTQPFVPVHELGSFFRASDIGVWPTQESTSMLDAAACGLPIIANHTMSARERLEGNGLAYKLNDLEDLVRVLLELRNPQSRERMGSLGASKMMRDFSWESIARRRLNDYEAALRSRKRQQTAAISKEESLG